MPVCLVLWIYYYFTLLTTSVGWENHERNKKNASKLGQGGTYINHSLHINPQINTYLYKREE